MIKAGLVFCPRDCHIWWSLQATHSSILSEKHEQQVSIRHGLAFDLTNKINSTRLYFTGEGATIKWKLGVNSWQVCTLRHAETISFLQNKLTELWCRRRLGRHCLPHFSQHHQDNSRYNLPGTGCPTTSWSPSSSSCANTSRLSPACAATLRSSSTTLHITITRKIDARSSGFVRLTYPFTPIYASA